MSKLTHLDERGAARMVDVSGKDSTTREATAEAIVTISPEAFAAIGAGEVPKGDVLATARIAGIMAAKKTHELIPLCHPLPISKAAIEFELRESESAVRIVAGVKTTGQTGVEMEALLAASIAALTVYDMIKAIDKAAVIGSVRLLSKSGGKSGDYKVSSSAREQRLPIGPRANNGRTRANPSALPDGVVTPIRQQKAIGEREAFRAFMAARRLRATEWAKQAGVPASQIYSYLTGKSRSLPTNVAEQLAKAARVRVEDMFR